MSGGITNEQFGLIGKLAVNFNAIDELVTLAVCALLQCAEFEAGKALVDKLPSERKLDELKRLVELHAEKKAQADAPIVVELASLVGKIRGLTERRNALFHAHISSPFQGHVEYRSARTGKAVAVSTDALRQLVQDCVSAAKQTHELMCRFMTEFRLDTKQVSFLP